MKADYQGRIFEVGFNIGILTCFEQYEIGKNWLDFYQNDLQKLRFQPFLKELIKEKNVISPVDQDIVSHWTQFLLWRGFLGGLNFGREYLESTGWLRFKDKIEVLYFQCSFIRENSFNLNKKDEEVYYQELLAQFQKNVNSFDEASASEVIKNYQRKGEFLKADTLLLLRFRGKKYRLLTVDTSLFSLKIEGEVFDVNYLNLIRKKIVREVNYFRSKSVFSHLNIDTGTKLDFCFSTELKDYFTAFKYEDKESSKLIQAAGYAYSFVNFLEKIGIFSHSSNFIINSVGYSDRHVSGMTVNQDNWQLLKPCYEIYKYDSSDKEIATARKIVLDLIKSRARKSFPGNGNFINDLFNLQPNKIKTIIYQEKLPKFANTAGEITSETKHNIDINYYNPVGKTLRDAHADLIKKALNSDDTYIFLTGNPGIGKTTALTDFLTENAQDGFLFFYVSPRTQVNLDIIAKFKEKQDQNKRCEQLFCINTDRKIIDSNNGKYTVKYFSEQKNEVFKENNVDFIPDQLPNTNLKPKKDSTQRKTQELVTTSNLKYQGVIDSICEGIFTIIDKQISHQIVASVSIQALKKTFSGDTLEHFGKIFKGAYNSKQGLVIPEKMQEISRRIKHIFIMIDEITGDDSGVNFLDGIRQQLKNYELLDGKHGFNTKIIVADASIVDKNVITQHLENITPEPDKIFFRKAENEEISLSLDKFLFKNLPATIINTNSYPANSLTITYKIILQSTIFQEKDSLKQDKDKLQENLEIEIIKDIQNLYFENGQILVFIQNKQKLQDLITELKNIYPQFEKTKQYLEVHANTSDEDKKELQKYLNDVKIIFMTSSGSRGLSFPKVKHILVDIPRFQVENNLMEIIQVIYRGRGDRELDKQDKQLFFYLAEKSVHYQEENIELSLQESLLNIVNILLLLKAAILTRINGVGKIGRDNFLIIPIGGKSISSAGESFTKQLSNLLRELKNEYRLKPSHKNLENAARLLQDLLSYADFVITPNKKNCPSYLKLIESVDQDFLKLIEGNFYNLLSYKNIQSGYIFGSLLLIPTENNKLEETYFFRLEELRKKGELLLEILREISNSRYYHQNLSFATKNAIDLIKKLADETLDKSQKFQQFSQKNDEYYGIPLFVFLNSKEMKEYLATESEKDIKDRFRYILEQYIRSLYPVGNMLPLGSDYSEFPFIFFSSYSLKDMRNNVLTDRYLFNSNELNILNLILSKHN